MLPGFAAQQVSAGTLQPRQRPGGEAPFRRHVTRNWCRHRTTPPTQRAIDQPLPALAAHRGQHARTLPPVEVLQQQGRSFIQQCGRDSGTGRRRQVNRSRGPIFSHQRQHQPRAAAPTLRAGPLPERRPIDLPRAEQVVDIRQQERPAIEPVAIDRVGNEVRQHVGRGWIGNAVRLGNRPGPDPGIDHCRTGVIHPPVRLPQAVVQFHHRPPGESSGGRCLSVSSRSASGNSAASIWR